MRIVKVLSSAVVRASLIACGGLVVLTAMSGTASAFVLPGPEIDPASATSAVTLLVGSMMLLTAKRCK